MKLIEIKYGKRTYYVNPEYIIDIREWITEGTYEISLTKGDSILIKKDMLDKILKEINDD